VLAVLRQPRGLQHVEPLDDEDVGLVDLDRPAPGTMSYARCEYTGACTQRRPALMSLRKRSRARVS
jgi:hypothetical protein